MHLDALISPHITPHILIQIQTCPPTAPAHAALAGWSVVVHTPCAAYTTLVSCHLDSYKYAPTSSAWIVAYGPHNVRRNRLYPAMALMIAGMRTSALIMRPTKTTATA